MQCFLISKNFLSFKINKKEHFVLSLETMADERFDLSKQKKN
jgi:hypothetical protein